MSEARHVVERGQADSTLSPTFGLIQSCPQIIALDVVEGVKLLTDVLDHLRRKLEVNSLLAAKPCVRHTRIPVVHFMVTLVLFCEDLLLQHHMLPALRCQVVSQQEGHKISVKNVGSFLETDCIFREDTVHVVHHLETYLNLLLDQVFQGRCHCSHVAEVHAMVALFHLDSILEEGRYPLLHKCRRQLPVGPALWRPSRIPRLQATYEPTMKLQEISVQCITNS